jgi:5-hydroxyisourate hydrolase-like protein (transthyretin family)
MRFCFLAFLPLVIIGCNISTPPELRNLSSVTIVVTNDGQPVRNVHVSLTNKKPQNILYSYGGVTDTEGRTKIQTTLREYVRTGVPSGNYSVVFRNVIVFPADLESSEEEISLPEIERKKRQAKRVVFEEQNRVIPEILESSKTSPIELTVEEKKGTELMVDISKYR